VHLAFQRHLSIVHAEFLHGGRSIVRLFVCLEYLVVAFSEASLIVDVFVLVDVLHLLIFIVELRLGNPTKLLKRSIQMLEEADSFDVHRPVELEVSFLPFVLGGHLGNYLNGVSQPLLIQILILVLEALVVGDHVDSPLDPFFQTRVLFYE